jgi:hypothetical protein
MTQHRQRWNIVRALGDVWRELIGLLTALGERDGSFGVTDRRLACDGRPRLSRVMHATLA